ncbi:hypothetical protein [Burkholderia lata]|uniref:hypothetical protein n=1 Tax=Burkholderia lata (strain ATCC 17760 / DSM 23089 / LMG 22485 / NCIMB 9086 / R18194 / 383) TaxID=482957 RepID=UPI0020C71BD7|nr:hypothetical protein [Burkholderia lata]
MDTPIVGRRRASVPHAREAAATYANRDRASRVASATFARGCIASHRGRLRRACRRTVAPRRPVRPLRGSRASRSTFFRSRIVQPVSIKSPIQTGGSTPPSQNPPSIGAPLSGAAAPQPKPSGVLGGLRPQGASTSRPEARPLNASALKRTAVKPEATGHNASLLEATPAELQTVAHHPVLQPVVLHSAHPHEGNLIDLSDPPSTTKPTGTPSSLLEATPDELQTVAHHAVLQPAVLHSAHVPEGDLIDLSDPPPAPQAAHGQPSPLGAEHAQSQAAGTPPSKPASAAEHEAHGAHDAQTLAAAGMPSIQQIHHETAQTIRMQRAIGFANQLLAVAEMINSFQMKLIDMIKKAVSR